MKAYFAWVFFLLAVINVPRLIYLLSTDPSKAPTDLYAAILSPTMKNIRGAASSFAWLALYSLLLYFWWHWK